MLNWILANSENHLSYKICEAKQMTIYQEEMIFIHKDNVKIKDQLLAISGEFVEVFENMLLFKDGHLGILLNMDTLQIRQYAFPECQNSILISIQDQIESLVIIDSAVYIIESSEADFQQQHVIDMDHVQFFRLFESILIQNNDYKYLYYKDNMTELDLQGQIIQTYTYNDKAWIHMSDSRIIQCNHQFTQFHEQIIKAKSVLFAQNKICILEDHDLIIASLITQESYRFVCDFVCKDFKFISFNLFFLQDNQNNIYQIYKPDFQSLFKQAYPQKSELKLSEEQLFSMIKKQSYTIDESIQLCLKYGYLKPLLLICARIRVFREFFTVVKKISENNHERDILPVVNFKNFKDCEVIQKFVLDEFVEQLLEFDHVSSLYFTKFCIEHMQLISDRYHYDLLQKPMDREQYQQRGITLPQIPDDAMSRALELIKFLQLAKAACYRDFFRLKERHISQQVYSLID